MPTHRSSPALQSETPNRLSLRILSPRSHDRRVSHHLNTLSFDAPPLSLPNSETSFEYSGQLDVWLSIGLRDLHDDSSWSVSLSRLRGMWTWRGARGAFLHSRTRATPTSTLESGWQHFFNSYLFSSHNRPSLMASVRNKLLRIWCQIPRSLLRSDASLVASPRQPQGGSPVSRRIQLSKPTFRLAKTNPSALRHSRSNVAPSSHPCRVSRP